MTDGTARGQPEPDHIDIMSRLAVVELLAGQAGEAAQRIEAKVDALTGHFDASTRRIHSRIDRVVYGAGASVIAILLTVIGWLVSTSPPWAQG